MPRQRASLRQPLLVYASLFMVVLALVVGVISWFSLVTASRRAYRRAARKALEAVAHQRPLPQTQPWVTGARRGESPLGELTIGIVSSSSSAFGLGLAEVRSEAISPDLRHGYVCVPLDVPGREVYLVALFDSSVPMSIALVEVARMTPFVLLGALGCAGMLVILVGRVLLPPLDALRRAAQETQASSTDGLTVPAPNEILDVAHQFRRTVRQLNDEREVVEAQRDELARMQQNLIRASKLASVGRLAAGIAHEIGNPLAAVQGYLSLLKAGLPADQAGDVLDRSRAELSRIHDTILKLLTYARTGEERPEEPGPFDLNRVVQDAIELARGHPALKGVNLSVADTEIPSAHGHPGHLHQVMVNLLLNAGQALEEEREGRIRVDIEQDEALVIISVIDDGPGVPDDLKEVIFDPFYTTKAPGQGTGLGLAVSRALMETMGGDLTVDDGPDGGAAFRLVVPKAG